MAIIGRSRYRAGWYEVPSLEMGPMCRLGWSEMGVMYAKNRVENARYGVPSKRDIACFGRETQMPA